MGLEGASMSAEPLRGPGAADPVPGQPDPTLPLLLVHIPRTAGSTLQLVFRSALGHERTLLAAHWYDTRDRDLSTFAFVEGHLTADWFADKFGTDWHSNAITMLRDPVARTVSQVRHIRAIPGPLQELVREKVRDPAVVFDRIPHLVNLQTKYLSRASIDAVVGARALAEAKSTLDRMAFGLTEAFDSSLALMLVRLRLGVPEFGIVNAASEAHDDDLLSEDFRAAAREHNEVDAQLYEYATSMLQSRMATYAESLLALPAEASTLTCELRVRGQRIERGWQLPIAEAPTARCSGWVLVDGRPADAVLARVEGRVIPFVPRVERSEPARATREIDNAHSGVVATLSIPPRARSLEIIAFDRKRNLRACREIEITRVPPAPVVSRLPTVIKNRVGKILRR
jgi:hypothetical protein